MNTVFPDGATERELLEIYRPRPGLPFMVTTLISGPPPLSVPVTSLPPVTGGIGGMDGILMEIPASAMPSWAA